MTQDVCKVDAYDPSEQHTTIVDNPPNLTNFFVNKLDVDEGKPSQNPDILLRHV